MARRPHTSRQARAVLRALADDPSLWWYGYDLGRRLKIKSGTLYPLLIRLADDGFLDARWEAGAGRPPRHHYRLTAAGRVLAAERAAEFGAALSTHPASTPIGP